MPSSERVIGAGARRAETAARTAPPSGPNAGTILRGRASGPHAATIAVPDGGWAPDGGWDANSAPTFYRDAGRGAVGQAGTGLAVDLQQAHRIAEERGHAAGLAQAQAELGAAIAAAGSLAAELEAAAPRETTSVAHAIAELSLAVARRILGYELHVDPGVLVSSLETAVATINGSPTAHVLLHPDAVDRVREAWEAAHGRAHVGKRWVFESDPSLPRGGCVLRYDHGFVDAGLEAQLEEIGIALDAAIPGYIHDGLSGRRGGEPA
jgi:hypothetical protein